MLFENLYFWVLLTSGGAFVIALSIRTCPPLARALLLITTSISLFLFITKTPDEGLKDTLTADTKRILRVDRNALEDYHRQTGRYPAVHNVFQELQLNSRSIYSTDAWGNELRYTLNAGVPQLRSAGPDEQMDTADDLTL